MDGTDEDDLDDDGLLTLDVIATAVDEHRRRNSSGYAATLDDAHRGGKEKGNETQDRPWILQGGDGAPNDMYSGAKSGRGNGNYSGSDDGASLKDDYEGSYEVVPLLDLERLKWTNEGGIWVPCRTLLQMEAALENLGDHELEEGEVWVRYFPTRNTDHKQHMRKKREDLMPFNYQEDGGAARWSSHFKNLGPRASVARKKRRLTVKKTSAYTHKNWSIAMDFAEKTLEASLAAQREKSEHMERERRLAATLEVISSDDGEGEPSGAMAGSEWVPEGGSATKSLASDLEKNETVHGRRMGRGNVTLRVGDRIEYKLRTSPAGQFNSAVITGVEPRKTCPLELNVMDVLDLDVLVKKTAKYLPKKGVWRSVPETQRKLMPLGQHHLPHGGQADAQLSELLGPSEGGLLKALVKKESQSLRDEAKRFLTKQEDEEGEGRGLISV